MRDPARIDAVLDELRVYWRRYPDLRLAQLVINLAPYETVGGVYQFEDDQLLERLRRANAEGRPLSEADLHGLLG